MIELNLNEIELVIKKEVSEKIRNIVAGIDIGTEISNQIRIFVENKMMSSALPERFIPASAINTADLLLSGDNIMDGTIRGFASTGIQDISSETELTIMDGAVVAESNLITKELSVDGPAEFKSSINVVGDLRLNGDLIMMNTKFNDQILGLIENQISAERSRELDIAGSSLLSNGKELLNHSSLGPSVIYSNLRKIGNLQDLNVIGPLAAADTLSVADHRVGINTDSPQGALTIWDEDAELTIRKHKSRTTFIGTSRDCDLVIGVNGEVLMRFDRTGSVSVKSFEIGGLHISVSDNTPEHEGRPGDLVIMSRAIESQPWAYQCVEGKKWVALMR